MQTFITDTRENEWGVKNLDQKRLVKQLLECRQIMAALAGETKGWVNHPATKMWRGREYILYTYALHVAWEMRDRGYAYSKNMKALNESYDKIMDARDTVHVHEDFSPEVIDKIVYTHRGRLYEKDSEHYAQWSTYTDYKKNVCCDRCNYYWPTHLEK